MLEYRYHRVAVNDFGWKWPHGGRLSDKGDDYVSKQGFGHEDWNFSKDVWEDGKYHLYLKQRPKSTDIDKVFNLTLGVHTQKGTLVIGFAESVKYGVSNLPENIWTRRAEQIQSLEESGQLGELYSGKSLKFIAQDLMDERAIYNVSVETCNLHILDQPRFIPSSIYSVSTPMYRLLPMTAAQYAELSSSAIKDDTALAASFDTDASFPEGAQVEKVHKSRERNKQLVAAAKAAFLIRHGELHCEACGMEPSDHFKDASLASKIIEAHHNVSISDPSHSGKTKIKDLTMLCPSCHRAIHTIRPWLTVSDLKKKFDDQHN